MEVVTGLLFVSYCGVNNFCLSLGDLYGLVLVFLFLVLFFFDYRYYIIPDKILIVIAVFTLVYSKLFTPESIPNLLITGLVAASFFAIIYLVSKGRWMGFGDVKLAFVIGLVLGYPRALVSILLSIWAGALWGIGLMLLGKATIKSALPFGSFMAVVTILLIIFKNYDFKILQIFQAF